VNVTIPALVSPGRIGLPILAAPDAALGVGSISASTRSAKVGDTVNFNIKVQNLGRGEARDAQLSVRFLVDGRAAGGQNLKLTIGAGRTEERKVPFKVPEGRNIQVIATVSVNGDSNAGNNTGSASLSIG
jgi:subtilase family serine protease